MAKQIKSLTERDGPILNATMLKIGPRCGTSEH